MPYIPQDIRKHVELMGPRTAGELNYLITKELIQGEKTNDLSGIYGLLKEYVGYHATHSAVNYQVFNDVSGAVTNAVGEYYRRMGGNSRYTQEITHKAGDALEEFYDNYIAPYEDQKIKENGDVYPQYAPEIYNYVEGDFE